MIPILAEIPNCAEILTKSKAIQACFSDNQRITEELPMKIFVFTVLMIAMFGLTACQPDVCSDGSITYLEDASQFPAQGALMQQGPEDIQIGKNTISFDRVIHGPVCNDTWTGKVYVACDITIQKWEKTPKFLEGCTLDVDPDAVIYVAAHNNAPYYKGCGECH
jgi:hypothetical protein